MEKTFTAREHLESLVVATQLVFKASSDPAHHVIAGVFEACLIRMDFLYGEIDRLQRLEEDGPSFQDELKIGDYVKICTPTETTFHGKNGVIESINTNAKTPDGSTLPYGVNVDGIYYFEAKELEKVEKPFAVGDCVQFHVKDATFDGCASGVIETINNSAPGGEIYPYGIRVKGMENCDVFYFAEKELEHV